MSRRLTVLGIAVVGLTLTLTETVRGNGHEFFPAATGRTVELVYFGRIKDKTTGRLVRDRAFLTIFDNASGMSFPFTNDTPAHFRSPDVGAAIKELNGVKADPKQLEIQLMVAGYKDTRIIALPGGKKGRAVELNFLIEPVTAGQGSQSTSALSPGALVGSHWNRIIAVSAVSAAALLIAAVMARRSVLR
jgi:hypothetical protein